MYIVPPHIKTISRSVLSTYLGIQQCPYTIIYSSYYEQSIEGVIGIYFDPKLIELIVLIKNSITKTILQHTYTDKDL